MLLELEHPKRLTGLIQSGIGFYAYGRCLFDVTVLSGCCFFMLQLSEIP